MQPSETQRDSGGSTLGRIEGLRVRVLYWIDPCREASKVPPVEREGRTI